MNGDSGSAVEASERVDEPHALTFSAKPHERVQSATATASSHGKKLIDIDIALKQAASVIHTGHEEVISTVASGTQGKHRRRKGNQSVKGIATTKADSLSFKHRQLDGY